MWVEVSLMCLNVKDTGTHKVHVCALPLHVIPGHPGDAAVTLCRDVFSTSWNGEGSTRICSISIGLSSSASSQALICISQSEGREITEFLLIDKNGLLAHGCLCACITAAVQYLLWGHGVSQRRGRWFLAEKKKKIRQTISRKSTLVFIQILRCPLVVLRYHPMQKCHLNYACIMLCSPTPLTGLVHAAVLGRGSCLSCHC